MVEYVRGSGLSSNEKEFPECADPFQEILPSAHPRTVPGLGVRSGRSYDLCVLLIGVSILQLRKLDRRCCKAGKEGLCVGPVQARTRVRACAHARKNTQSMHPFMLDPPEPFSASLCTARPLHPLPRTRLTVPKGGGPTS